MNVNKELSNRNEDVVVITVSKTTTELSKQSSVTKLVIRFDDR